MAMAMAMAMAIMPKIMRRNRGGASFEFNCLR
jgi:hypothetical protein